jgi:hypothetical protein
MRDLRRPHSLRPSPDRSISPWVLIVICLGLTVICLIAIWFGRMNIVPLEVSSAGASRALAEKLTVQLGERFGSWWCVNWTILTH